MPRLRGRGAAVAALIGYGLLTLVMTYPLVRRFTSAIPGDGFDGWQNYWNLWWVRQALLVEHTHPWFTDMLYSPAGVSLLFHTLNLFNGLTTLPIQLAWGLLPAYNSAVLFSFAMSGLGAYLLARYVLGPALQPSGGVRRRRHLHLFAVPHRASAGPHAGHQPGVDAVFRAVPAEDGGERACEERSGSWSESANHATSRATFHVATCHNVLLAILFLVLVALCDWYYVLYCLIFTAVVFVWVAVRAWRARRSDGRARSAASHAAPTPARRLVRIPVAIAVIWLLWAVVLSPVLAPMIREARASRFMVPDPEHSRTLSADLLGFVTPQEFHPLWGTWARRRASALSRHVSEHQVFAGFTVLVLALIGAGRLARLRSAAMVARASARRLPASLALGRARVLRPGARPRAAHRRTDGAAAGRPRDSAALRVAGARRCRSWTSAAR